MYIGMANAFLEGGSDEVFGRDSPVDRLLSYDGTSWDCYDFGSLSNIALIMIQTFLTISFAFRVKFFSDHDV